MIETAEKEENIPKVLFVLSDMQFNEAVSGNENATGHEKYS